MQVWHCPNVENMRRKLTLRAYTCLAVYTLAIAWVNLCYVATYDTQAVRWAVWWGTFEGQHAQMPPAASHSKWLPW